MIEKSKAEQKFILGFILGRISAHKESAALLSDVDEKHLKIPKEDIYLAEVAYKKHIRSRLIDKGRTQNYLNVIY